MTLFLSHTIAPGLGVECCGVNQCHALSGIIELRGESLSIAERCRVLSSVVEQRLSIPRTWPAFNPPPRRGAVSRSTGCIISMCNSMHSLAMIHHIVGSCMRVEELPPTSGQKWLRLQLSVLAQCESRNSPDVLRVCCSKRGSPLAAHCSSKGSAQLCDELSDGNSRATKLELITEVSSVTSRNVFRTILEPRAPRNEN
eukprot:3933279-Rhodomonas_salina.5